MTIEHKLQHFEELCIHSAQEAGEKMTADYTAYLESVLRDHEENVRKQAEARIQTDLIDGQPFIGFPLYGFCFRLDPCFMETPAYETLLKEQIRKARDFAQGEEIHIYIDPADQEKQNLLSMETGCDIRVSQYPFSGFL